MIRSTAQRRDCLLLATASWMVLSLVGCGPSPKPSPTSTNAEQSGATSSVPPAPMASDPEQIWGAITALAGPAPEEEQVLEDPPSAETQAGQKQAAGVRAMAAAELARQFYGAYPQDPRAGLAHDVEYKQLLLALALDQTNALPKLEALESAWLADPNVPEQRRLALKIQQLQRQVAAQRSESIETALEEMERGARELRAEFPNRPEAGGLLITVARGWLELNNSVRSLALVRDVLSGNPVGDVKESAESLQRQLQRLGQPLDLRFTATDGSEVDLAKLKGKVVLIDFWATWCGPCIEGLADLRQLYHDLQPKGFEIIGISFDQNRAEFDQFVQREKVTWPQYFEAKQPGNRFGELFGISGIPAFWLVDKEGRLRDLGAGSSLRPKVERLLAE